MTPISTRLATCFGIGWSPVAPGTVASVAALPFGWLLVLLGWQAVLIGALFATALGVWACGVHAKRRGMRDPSECVLDEVAGQWFTLIPIAMLGRGGDWRPYAMALLLFRLFDIFKPWPVSAVERWRGGWGVMMDDVLAGLFGAGILYGVLWIRLV